MKYFRSVVTGNVSLRENVRLITMKKEFAFIPGQVVALSLDFNPEPRLYSIASGTGDKDLSVLYDIHQEGAFSPRLGGLLPGEPIYVSEPIGTFVCDEKPAVWIATGTGVAPFLSMFRSGNHLNKILIHGGSTLDSFYFQKDLTEKMQDRYIRCCSWETREGIFHGRVTAYIRDRFIPGTAGMYYLCGSAEMIVDVRDILISRGIPFENIMAEIYF